MREKLRELLQSDRVEEPPRVALAGADLSADRAALSALNCLGSLGRIRPAGLWDPVKARRDAAGEFLRVPTENRFSDPDELLRPPAPPGAPRRKGPDALLVIGPLENRSQVIRNALERRIHVLADAPLAPSAPEAEALVDAAAASGAHLGVLHPGRYRAIHAETLWAVRDRRLGEILFVRIERPSPADPGRRSGGDEWMDLYGDVYLARAWANAPVTSVFAHAGSLRSGKREVSVCLLQLRHAGGGVSTVRHARTVGPSQEACEIHGAEGSLRLDPRENAWFLCRREAGEGAGWERNEAGAETLRGGVTMAELPADTGARAYARALDDAFASFARDLPPPIDGREAWLNLRALDAARESARRGDAIRVDIPFPR